MPMEVKLLAKGYQNNETFYKDFLEDKINAKEDYFSKDIAFIDMEEASDFPIYMGVGGQEKINRDFLKAFCTISESYIDINRDYILDGTFWHSFLVTHKRQYILEHYPEVQESVQKFNNIVLKKFDWENYIYKCVIGAQYVHDHVEETEKKRYFQLIIDNLDVYNYIIKYPIFRNDVFLIKALDIIDELGLSKLMKAKIKDREDLGQDERYGRRVFFEFNKSYPVVMAPLLEKEELKEYFIMYLGYYYDVSQMTTEAKIAYAEASSTHGYDRVAEPYSAPTQEKEKTKVNSQLGFTFDDAEIEPRKPINKNELLKYLEQHELEYIDHRLKGGSLWVIGNRSIGKYLKPLRALGIKFKYKPVGGKAFGRRSAWFWYGK